jgi:hypothetical protein
MRTFLLVTCLMLAGEAASANGTTILWSRMEGAPPPTQENACVEGPFTPQFSCPVRARTVGPSRVVFNLDSGYLFFAVEGLSNGSHYPGPIVASPASSRPLGGVTASLILIGTIVCDSTEQSGVPMQFVDTPPIEFKNGNGAFKGQVVVPAGCKARPEETVFLLRIATPGSPSYGAYVAYGAGRKFY